MKNKEIEKKKTSKKVIIPVIGLLIAILLIGASYAVWNYTFNGTLKNTISTPEISLDLLESNENIINIENALPISDNEGKVQSETFDFAVTSKTLQDIDVEYTVSIQKLEVDSGYTSLSDNQIKVYLTDYSGTQLVAPTLISNLSTYKLYTGTHSHDATHEVVQDKFKLRAWINGSVDASSWTEATKLQYKFKIGLTSEEKQPSQYPEYVYRYGTNSVNMGDSILRETKQEYVITNGSGGPSDKYNTLSECEAGREVYMSRGMPESFTCQQQEVTTGFDYTEDYTTLNKSFFLKYNISSEGTVESSEVCYILNNTLYCLKGEKTDDKESGYISQYYEENTNILKTSFGESNCSVTSNGVNCDDSASGLYASAESNGNVLAGDDSSNCRVNYDGSDYCYWW